MRAYPLSAVKAGITRLRLKGGASPDSLYDLQNGYVNSSGMPTIRPGTEHEHRLPQGTKGLAVNDGLFHVFSHEAVTMTDARFVCDILRHPTESSIEIIQIHFSEEFMGVLFVVAEFANNDIFYYWLEDFPEWEAATGYNIGDRVIPTVGNGYAYIASRLGSPHPKWAANTPRAIGDKVEPTVYNGYYYEVVDVEGDHPASGSVEPSWPVVDDALYYEDTDGSTFTYSPEVGGDGDVVTNPGNGAVGSGNYSNPGGNVPGIEQ